jgi:uncharacterized protein YbaA (DUF1428 family)
MALYVDAYRRLNRPMPFDVRKMAYGGFRVFVAA